MKQFTKKPRHILSSEHPMPCRSIKGSSADHKTLCIQQGNRVERYRYARKDGRGDEYIGDEWFESYIVTPQGELLTWTTSGNYIPSAREFWFE